MAQGLVLFQTLSCWDTTTHNRLFK